MEEHADSYPISASIGIDSRDISIRKAFLEFTAEDAELLKALHVRLETQSDVFSEAFYSHLSHFPEISPLIGDGERLARLKKLQSVYFNQLTAGEYDAAYVENRLSVGIAHQRVGLTPKWYIGAYRKYLHELMGILVDLFHGDAEQCSAVYAALLKVVFFDIELVLDTYSNVEQQEIIREKKYTEQMLAEMPVGLAMVDTGLTIRSANTAFLRMLKLNESDECIGFPVADVLGNIELDFAFQSVLQGEEARSGLSFEYDDTEGRKYYLADISRVQTETEETLFMLMVQDVTAYRQVEERAQYLAQYDALTELPNRDMIYTRIDYACSLSKRGDGTVVILMVDLDRFKVFNDNFGPEHGDALLKQAVARLRNCLRESDTLGRTGSNEFVMILLRMSAPEDAAAKVKKIFVAFEEPFQVSDQRIYMTVSAGIAISGADGGNAQELLQSAATALHQAKKDGGNQFRFFQQGMNQDAHHDMQLESGLHRALELEEFELHYQPQVDLHTGNIIGVEALLRWRHAEHGLIAPADFIPLLERSGMIVAVGLWVLRTACAQAKRWHEMGLNACRVAVNLSAVQFHRQNLCEVIQQVLLETGLEANLLELEITESTIMKDVDGAVQTLQNLKKIGVRLSVDDFGTGHSSLNYLKRFETDVLKIDQSFVRDIVTNADDALITRTIIDLAHNMRMKVIAEGVETEEQLAFLFRNGCDEIQGFHFSTPLPVEACTALLKEDRKLIRPEINLGRSLLLVDDEENILSALKRLFRRDGYQIFTASSAKQGLELLMAHPIGVIVSDQRMPEMCGTDFLSKVKDRYPDTVRIVLSGYTDLQSITDAINRGAIYKFLTKPWEDDLLRANIQEAFERYELGREKNRLTAELIAANHQLGVAKLQLEGRVDAKSLEALRNLNILRVSQEVLESLPVGVIGVDDDGLIALSNAMANKIFLHYGNTPLSGEFASERLPAAMLACLSGDAVKGAIECRLDDGRKLDFWCHRTGTASQGCGTVFVFLPNG